MKIREPKYSVGELVKFKNKGRVWNGASMMSGVIKKVEVNSTIYESKGKKRSSTQIAYEVRYQQGAYSVYVNEGDICDNTKEFYEKERKRKKTQALSNLKRAENALERNKKKLAELQKELKELE